MTTMKHPKKWWGIRHIRCIYLAWRVHRWARMCGEIGLGLGSPNQADLDHLQAIWDGRV